MQEERDARTNFSSIVLFGILSIVCAEMFSGSAPLWMWDLWGLLVVLPLYWGHGLLLLNIALRYQKTSVTHLYILGIIYGLYESWMTKVIWAGYMGQDPQFGQFLGFAIGEFLVIALFWHAIFSFIVPIFVFQILGSKWGEFTITKKRIAVFGVIVLIASIFIPTGLVFDLGATIVAVLSNGLLLTVAIGVTKALHPHGFALDSLRLGKRGLSIVGAYILLLYVFLFIVIFPERIAPPFTLMLTVLFYLLVIAMFYFSKEKQLAPDIMTDVSGFNRKHILAGFAIIFALAILWTLLSPIASILGTLLYLGMVIAGPMLFIIALLQVMTRRI
ncbi:MAG: hypothetical protein ACFFED_07400 [Candidatus Thorarchaeota archaeon]